VERDAGEEDDHEWHPLEVLEEGRDKALFLHAVAEDSEGHVTNTGEDDDDGDVDFEGIEVVVVEPSVVPTDGKVVEHG